MAEFTPKIGLEQPAQTDLYNVDVFNANAEKIDAAFVDTHQKIDDDIAALETRLEDIPGGWAQFVRNPLDIDLVRAMGLR